MSETRDAAFAAIQPTLNQKQLLVLCHITTATIVHEGLTLFELVRKMEWPVNRISGRVTELRKAGKIIDSGARRVNPESGKSAVVWKAAA